MRYLTTELRRVFHGVTLRKNRNSVTLWLNVPACIILLTLSIKQVQSQDLIRYVNPIIGTGPATTESAIRHGAGTEEKGQTFPGVGRPFGMTQWTAETRITETKCVSPYYYNDKFITGFRGSRWMSGSCTQDYGSATIMPFITTRPDTISRNPVSAFSHNNETSTPAFYKVGLESYPVNTELTGTERCGMMRFSFSGEGDAYLLIRINSDERQGNVWIDRERKEIICKNPVHRIYQGSGKYAGFSGYFVIRTDKPFESVSLLKGEQQLVVNFGPVKTLTVKSGSSFTGIEGARLNLDSEIPGWDFDKIREASESVWNETLAKVTVKGGQEDDLIRFYTALYHCYQLPRIASDADGSYIGFAQDTMIHKAAGFTYYDDFSMWDTYRALHPLMMILEPERTGDMIRSLVLKAGQGGWMPIFPAWGNYTAAMIGDHVSTMISDAYIKGITDFDTETAYKYMRKNAFEIPERPEYVDGKGRRALDSYIRYGYIPLEDSVWDAFHKNEQVSRTLEYALDDWALSQFAKALGKTTDYQQLLARSGNWKNVLDRESGFARGRYADGSWITPFDPYSKARFICEGTPFHYTWYVPQDVPGLIKAMGGKKAYLDKLDLFFAEGHYWHGNEPDHQAAFMFAMGGAPEITREWVQKIVAAEYGTGPGGLSGNEDAGQMSAWLVFAMMGFYPVCPASGNYVMSVPLFDEIDIRIPGRKDFIIRTENRRQGINAVLRINKNDKQFKDWQFSHNEIINGSKFTFILK